MCTDLKKLIRSFEEAQQATAEFGATDTEPDVIFQSLMVRAYLDSNLPRIPTTTNGWGLYRLRGSDDAAQVLAEAASKVVNFIAKNKTPQIGEQLVGYCWRVSFDHSE